ncbi:MAG: porin [Cytophagales bacterium]|nr:porin [Cytophagales bacterium]
MRKSLRIVGALLLSASLYNAQAQDSTAADKPKFSISGYIDSYYLTAFNNPASGNLMGANAQTAPAGAYTYGFARAFDRLTDQFALGLVQTKFAYSDKWTDMVVDLTFGPNAELGNFGNQRYSGGQRGYVAGFAPTNPNQDALYGTSAAIKQAYFTLKATSKLSFTVGQFGTHIGYEVIDAPVNYHYSLSNLFNNGPFYHVGAKANYMISDKLGLMVGIVNNWDALTDWKKQKSTIAQVFISPVAGWNIYLNYIGGYGDDGFKVIPASGSFAGPGQSAYPLTQTTVTGGLYTPFKSYVRNLFDLTTGYQVTDKLYFGINAAYGFYALTDSTDIANMRSVRGDATRPGSDNNPGWWGAAFYANYKITDWLGIGARYEHFDDSNGLRYINAVNNSLTITAPVTLGDGRLTIKPEFRFDGSNVPLYERTDPLHKDENGGSATYASWTQQTLGVAFIYKY